MKKLILLGLCMVLFSSMVLAWEWDNVARNYDSVNRTIEIHDGYGMGGRIATIKLAKNTDQALLRGEAEFEIYLDKKYNEGIVDGTKFKKRHSKEDKNVRFQWNYLEKTSKDRYVQVYNETCKTLANFTRKCRVTKGS